MEIRIGCTGWSYAGWSGTFYPKKIKNENFLKYYSSIFDITEINSTFYRIPSSNAVKKWNYDTPKNFEFTSKFPKIVTHEKRLRDVKHKIIEFLASIRPIKQKTTNLILQLPPSLSFEEAKPRLQELLKYLPDYYRYPVEGRNESWFTKEAINFLSENNICLVWSEVENVKNPAPITSDYIYLRLIGDRTIPEEKFGKIVKNEDVIIKKWSQKLKSVNEKVTAAIVMANNHLEGFAPTTANKLRIMLGYPNLSLEGTKQKTITDF